MERLALASRLLSRSLGKLFRFVDLIENFSEDIGRLSDGESILSGSFGATRLARWSI